MGLGSSFEDRNVKELGIGCGEAYSIMLHPARIIQIMNTSDYGLFDHDLIAETHVMNVE